MGIRNWFSSRRDEQTNRPISSFPPVFEMLEQRLLLSVNWDGLQSSDPVEQQTALTSLSAGALDLVPLADELDVSAEDLFTEGVRAIEWNGQTRYAAAGEWILRVEGQVQLPDNPKEVQFSDTLGSDDMFLVSASVSVEYEQLFTLCREISGFRYLEPNFVVWDNSTFPDDPKLPDLWGLHNTGQTGGATDADIDAPEAWDIWTGTGNVVIGIIDTGVDYTHPDLVGNMWTNPGEIVGDGIDNDGNGFVDDIHGWNWAYGGPSGINCDDPMDDHGHGTHVAGTIAGVGNDGQGIVGVNWNAEIMALKFLTGDGWGYTENAVAALNYATMMKRDYGVNVRLANNSWGGGGYSQALYDAIAASGDADMLFIAAAGNSNSNNDADPHYPSSYDLDNIIAVAATDHNDNLAEFSCYGLTSVDLAAPGVDILSAFPGNDYYVASGTSMAAPHVSGVAALLWSRFPSATREEIRDAIINGTDILPELTGKTVTGGRLNAYNAMRNMGLLISGSNPAEGDTVATPPTDYTIYFSDPYDPDTVDASDFTVNSVPADAFTLTDSLTITFHFNTGPVNTQGWQYMSVADGVINSLSDGSPIREWNAKFRYDALLMAVTSTVPADGSFVEMPFASVQVVFNEAYDPTSVDTDDLIISVGTVTGFGIVDATTVEYSIGGFLYEGPLSLSMKSGALTDVWGNPMQDYSGGFEIDFGEVSFPKMAAEAPAGSLIHSRGLWGSVGFAGDEDTFLLNLDGDQTLTVVADAGALLETTIELRDPSDAAIASVSGSAGEGVMLQAIPVSSAGVYKLILRGENGSTGDYTLIATLNAGREIEASGGADNDSYATSQNFDETFTNLGGSSSRGAIVGAVGSFRNESFEAGAIGPQWSTYSSEGNGRIQVTGEYGVAGGEFALLMDVASREETDLVGPDSGYLNCLNEAIWSVDLTGLTDVVLSFRHVDFYDEEHSFGGDFTNHYNADGIAISDDGINWHPVFNAPNQNVGQWHHYTVDLAAQAQAAGMTLGDGFRIKFQQYDNYPLTEDGRGWDEIALVTSDLQDYYSFTLEAGDFATLAVATTLDGNVELELYNQAGLLVAPAAPGDNTYDKLIEDFLVPVSGTYYARVTGDPAAAYSLIITRNVTLGTEYNDNTDDLDNAQDITISGIALGQIGPRMNRLFARYYDYGLIAEIDPLTGEILNSFQSPTAMDYSRFGMADTRTTLLISGNKWYELDPDTGECIRDFGYGFPAGGMAYMDQEIFLLDPTPGGLIRVYDYATAQLTRTLTVPQLNTADGLASSGTALYAIHWQTDQYVLFEIDPQTGQATSIADMGDESVGGGLAIIGDELFATVAEEIEGARIGKIHVYDLETLALKRILVPDHPMTGYYRNFVSLAGDGSLGPHDFYSFSVTAGDSLDIHTTTPGGGPGEFVNNLDPIIELYDPTGVLVVTDDNGGPDGHNALLNHVAATDGIYTVRVFDAGDVGGAYMLYVSGHTGRLEPLEVVATDPPDGQRLPDVPSQITVDFSKPVLFASLEAADLTIDDVPAVGYTVVDSDTVTFDLPTIGEGPHEVAIAAGAFMDLQGVQIKAFSSSFTVDLTAPRVISSSIQEGQVVQAGNQTIAVRFDEPLSDTELGPENVSLVSTHYGSFEPVTFDYDAVTSTLTLEFTDLPEDAYALTFSSGDDAFEDLVGHDLDGETPVWPIGPNVSGDGVAGGDFVVNFETDVDRTDLPDFESVLPAGSLIYNTRIIGNLWNAGDSDAYRLNLDAGQTLSVIVHPNSSLQPTVSLIDPSDTVIAVATAAAEGRDAWLNSIDINSAGTYLVTVTGASAGTYSVEAILNAAIEDEPLSGLTNDDLASAQDLAPSSVSLADGIDRMAALGNIGIVAVDGFEGERLDHVWSVYTEHYRGFVDVSDKYGGAFGRQSLLLSCKRGSDWGCGTKEATWSVNLSGLTEAELFFWHLDSDGEDYIQTDYVGHIMGDGVSISDDGVNWHPVWLEPQSDSNVWEWHSIDLAAEAALAGMDLVNGFQIKFQQYGERSYYRRNWDEVAVRIPDAADLYQFDLQSGQAATAAVKTLKSGNVQIEILNSDGVVLATGLTSSENLDAVISDFVAPDSGTYYVRLQGDAGAEYSLVVTRGATFDTEKNNNNFASGSQDITKTGTVLGEAGTSANNRLFAVYQDPAYGYVHYARELDLATGRYVGSKIALPLQSSQNISGVATTDWSLLVGAWGDSQIYELELDTWQVFRTMELPYDVDPYSMTYMDNEIFVVSFSYDSIMEIYVLDYETGSHKDTIQTSSRINTVSSAHGVLYAGLGNTLYQVDRSTGDLTELGRLEGNFNILSVFNDEIISVSSGSYPRCGLYAWDLETFADRRPCGSVCYVESVTGGEGAADDYYSVEVNEGDLLMIATTTPGGGPFAFVNNLDPMVELYDPTGALVAGDDNSAPDGRNVSLTHQAADSGAYLVRVKAAESAYGEYFLSVTGYTGQIDFAVSATDPADGAEVTYEPAQMTIDFSKDVLLSTLDANDLTIGGMPATAYTVVDGNTIAFDLPVLDEGVYDVVIAAGAIDSVQGRPILPYAGRLALRVFDYPTPLAGLAPDGGMVYAGSQMTHLISSTGDTSSHKINLDPDQLLTVILKSSVDFRVAVEVFDPDGAPVATATASQAGQTVVLQALPITLAGAYTITVSGADDTVGEYTIRLILNAAVEDEYLGGENNDEPADAQNIDDSFIDPGGGVERGAVVGGGPASLDTPLFADGFESGDLGPAWSTYSSRINGRILVTQVYGASEGLYALYMDLNEGSSNSINEAILAVDFSSVSNAYLTFTHVNFGDSPWSFDGDFTDHYSADGVAISDDGVNWHPVWTPPNQTLGVWERYAVDLGAEAGIAGMALGANFRIKFQQHDYSNYGRAWDEILITPGADWYSFTLQDGQSASLVVDSDGENAFGLALYDPSGRLMTVGRAGPRTAAEVTELLVPSGLSGPQMGVIGPDGNLYVSNYDYNNVLRFDGGTGEYIDEFVASGSGDLDKPRHIIFGPDGNLYVASGYDGCVYRFNGQTGEFLDILDAAFSPFGITFGPDDNLYVSSHTGDSVYRFDILTGSLIDEFVTPGSGGLDNAIGLTFGPDGNLYVASYNNNRILRYDGGTGEFLDNFVSNVAGRLSKPMSPAFGIDGNLYVGSYGSRNVSSYDGQTGEFLDIILDDDEWNNLCPQGISFGPDGALYVTSCCSREVIRTDFRMLQMPAFNIQNVVAPTAGAYYARVAGDGDYCLVVTRGGAFDVEVNDTPAQTQDISVAETLLGGLGFSPFDNNDYFTFFVNAGDELILSTATPGDGPGQFENNLDPFITLYDPDGVIVAGDDNNAADGRNALLNYTAVGSGPYVVRVSTVSGNGEYLLRVTGNTGVAPAFAVVETTPADGERMINAPERITVRFSEAVLLPSLEASDITVGGMPLTGLEIVDGWTMTFDLPDLVEGEYDVVIAAAAVSDLRNRPIDDYLGQLIVDQSPPCIIDSSIQEDDFLPPGSLTYEVRFNEPINAANLDETDFALQGYLSGLHLPDNWNFDQTGEVLTIQYFNLPEDSYSLTLYSGDGRFEDMVEFDLDGEPGNWPIGPNTSGDGIEGGDFVVNFILDVATIVCPAPFVAIRPLSSLVYGSSISGLIGWVGDTDIFTVDLDAGQTITVTLASDADLQADIELYDPFGSLIGSVSAGSTGEELLLQTVTVANDGTYTMSINGLADSLGGYDVQVILNAAAEAEQHGGPLNDGISSAQDIDGSFIPLVGESERGAVLGTVALLPDMPFVTEDFEAGILGPAWSTYSSDGNGRIRFLGNYGVGDGSYAMLMDRYPAGGYTLNEAVWTVDLSNISRAHLSFWHGEFGDERDPFVCCDFTGHYNADGIAISDDGIHWRPIFNAPNQTNGTWRHYTINLAAEAAAAEMNLDADFRIKFQQYDERSLSSDGRGWDGIVITAPAISEDWYSLTLSAGESAMVALTELGGSKAAVALYDADGALLSEGNDATGDINKVIENFVAPSGGRYYVRITGSQMEYNLVVTKNAALEIEPNDTVAQARTIGEAGVILGQTAPFILDYYRIEVTAGDRLEIVTSTPGGGPFEFTNDLFPGLFLVDPFGQIVALDIYGAPDGRNALLTHTAAKTGTYAVGVYAVAGSGQYVLNVDSVPPRVLQSVVNDDLQQRSTISAVGFRFSEWTRIDPDALTIHNETTGSPVDISGAAVNYDAATNTATWELSGVTLPDGYYTAGLSAASVSDKAGNPLDGNGDGIGGDDYTFQFHRLEGDLSGDGLIGQGDLDTILGEWGNTIPPADPATDLSGDGFVGQDDLDIVLGNWGGSLEELIDDFVGRDDPDAVPANWGESTPLEESGAAVLADRASRMIAVDRPEGTSPVANESVGVVPPVVGAIERPILPARRYAAAAGALGGNLAATIPDSGFAEPVDTFLSPSTNHVNGDDPSAEADLASNASAELWVFNAAEGDAGDDIAAGEPALDSILDELDPLKIPGLRQLAAV